MDPVTRARTFFETNGRDIDRARFAYHFGTGTQDDLLDVLGRYQNEDGGFHGLEVDISAPVSNPFATELALRVCLEAGVPRRHPLLERAVAYLEETQDEDGCWRFAPAVYEHELAPWFAGWTWPSLNPECTIAGLLRELQLGSDQLHERVERLFERLARPEDLLGDQYYAVRPYAYYFLPLWHHPRRELYLSGVVWWLLRAETTIPDAGHFLEYVRGPHTFVGAALPPDVLNRQLDRLQAEQAEDGGWPSPYSEGWRGPVTVDALLLLKVFGRV
jgi:hypothetical protein